MRDDLLGEVKCSIQELWDDTVKITNNLLREKKRELQGNHLEVSSLGLLHEDVTTRLLPFLDTHSLVRHSAGSRGTRHHLRLSQLLKITSNLESFNNIKNRTSEKIDEMIGVMDLEPIAKRLLGNELVDSVCDLNKNFRELKYYLKLSELLKNRVLSQTGSCMNL